jgi:hypothetical protein
VLMFTMQSGRRPANRNRRLMSQAPPAMGGAFWLYAANGGDQVVQIETTVLYLPLIPKNSSP